MSDNKKLVARLRSYMKPSEYIITEDIYAAASAIEALEADNARLREALVAIEQSDYYGCVSEFGGNPMSNELIREMMYTFLEGWDTHGHREDAMRAALAVLAEHFDNCDTGTFFCLDGTSVASTRIVAAAIREAADIKHSLQLDEAQLQAFQDVLDRPVTHKPGLAGLLSDEKSEN